MPELPGLAAPTWGQGWIDAYLAKATPGDVLRDDLGRGARWWRTLFDGVAHLTDGRLARLEERVARQVAEIGTAFRLPGEAQERTWPLTGLPLLIGEDEWRDIADGVCQRADLLERVLEDIYGPQKLIASGALPAAAVAGSRHFVRSMIGLDVPGKHRLHVYAVDIGRGPDGEWRVLADHARTPTGAGYALENRLAAGRVMGTLHTRLHVQRLAGFFSTFREGLAASCRRADPRIGLLTPGRFSQSYPEQAHLARYLGLLLVEGADLAVRDGQLYVRTIEGLKRVDAVWRRMDSRYLDPLAFEGSAIGVPGLMDAMASGAAVIANAPGAGVVESPTMAAFLPMLAKRLTGEALKLPNIATWWCGQPRERAHVERDLDSLLIGPAHTFAPPGFDDLRPLTGASLAPERRAALLKGLAQRPQDYVGQEVVRLSTMPASVGGSLAPRPFTLRVFAARGADGQWTVMPGGFVRLGRDADVRATAIGEGVLSADACIVAHQPVETISLLPANVPIRRNPGTLPSRAADNLFWFGRYLERGEATLRLVRAALGGTLDPGGGASLRAATLDRIAGLLLSSGAAVIDDEDDEEDQEDGSAIHDLAELAEAALVGDGGASVASLLSAVRQIAEGTRDRLSADVWRLVEAPPPTLADRFDAAGTLDCAHALQARFSALAGLAAENMGRTAGWRFQDLGRRIERAAVVCRLLRSFGGGEADADDLATLLDLTDSQISYRARYLTGLALVPVRDLVALDPFNPRSLAFQVARIGEHLAALPVLRDDGMAEAHQELATELAAAVGTAKAESLGPEAVLGLENRLYALSEALGRRFFLQGAETLRAAGMTLA